MQFGPRWWHYICATGFTGIFIVPVLSMTVRTISLISSLSSTAEGAPSTSPAFGFVLVKAMFAIALLIAVLGLALSLYYDASDIAEDEWTPNPRLYGVLGLVYPLSLVVAGFYLYRRYRHIGIGGFPIDEPLSRDRLATSRWWYLIAIGPALLLVGFGLFLAPYGDTLSFAETIYLRIIGLVLPGGGGILLFITGLAADLSQVRSSGINWNPGKRRYQLPSMLIPGLIPFIAIVYLGNRHRHVSVP